ncbi:glutamate--tRNA ligase [Helicobacter cetorum]|uniref:Glutamate--tRNA ligase n=1 Tax=Helicobacter cetorum (strain ATCC BAA-540 / CCUG 52418 / MIT 99-5656) TaxID=1163745 RepID=I0ETC6_HELCM|nr:glutamate--tRNA ligase [Helicobacter cetorum]AFI06195.1 glutamyl-tRNA synthetase [Helicobacter cetorum MIT 99-5656]
MSLIVTRFAPSPTGYLHIGGLRTAIFNYLFARANQGKFFLRIEDTDLSRNCLEATKAIIEAFKWVGLEHDGEILYQSKRFELYKEYIQKLLDENKAYYCYMSKDELDTLREEQKARKETPRYDSRYRDFKGTPPKGIEPVVRIKVPQNEIISFNDGVKGEVRVNTSELDDFIIARSDGTPTYNFVVTIDDALMGVTDVIRGDDHLSNTPKQIVLYKALNFKIPNFFHVPMILDEEGHKLSKRHGATNVMDYKEMGYLKVALLNFLVRLGWSHKDQEIFSMQELLELFNPKDLNSSPSCFSWHKLNWLNAHYLKNQSTQELLELLKPFNFSNTTHLNPAQLDCLFDALKERSQTLQELALKIDEVLNAPTEYEEKIFKKLDKALVVPLLEKFKLELDKASFNDENTLENAMHNIIEKEKIKAGGFMQPLRLALLGKGGGIGLKETLFILGKTESLKRIENFLKAF